MFNYSRRTIDEIVPGTFARYSITRDARLMDNITQGLIQPILYKDRLCYDLKLYWHPEPIDAAMLIAITYKGFYAPLELICKCKLLYSDGNQDNIDANNLIWLFPKGGLEVPTIPGFYFIPSYTRYAASREGVVISLWKGDSKLLSLDKDGYIRLGLLRDDWLYYSTHHHRVLALTFLEYDENVNRMIVNHIDTVRSNNSLGNLEWVKQGDNIRHGQLAKHGFIGSARDCMTRGDAISDLLAAGELVLETTGLEVKDLLTDKITQYLDQECVAEALNVSKGTISLKLGGKAIYPVILDRYIVRKVGDEWPTWDVTKEYIQAKDKATIVKNVKTGEISTYSSAKTAYTALGLSKKAVTTSLRRRNYRVINDYQFKYASDPNEF